MGLTAWVLRENSAEKHSGRDEVLRIKPNDRTGTENDRTGTTVPHLPIAIRSITMSSAVISSPEAAEVPRGWALMSRSRANRSSPSAKSDVPEALKCKE